MTHLQPRRARSGIMSNSSQVLADISEFADNVGFGHPNVAAIQSSVNHTLKELASSEGEIAARLSQAISHGLLSPGKRARAVLTLSVVQDLGKDPSLALRPACAIEMLHTASLIVDDLPCMDNAHMRRGQPTTHVQFGEDTAILAAMTLLCESFAAVSGAVELDAQCRAEIASKLAAGAGVKGIAGGQLMDLHYSEDATTTSDVEQIYQLKTGALFASAAWIGGRVARTSEAQLKTLDAFGMTLGVAFQAYDDLADQLAGMSHAGKDVNADSLKSTVISTEGLDGATHLANRRFAEALDLLSEIGLEGGIVATFVNDLRDRLIARHQSDSTSKA